MLEITIVSVVVGVILHFINDRLYIFYYLFLYFLLPFTITLLFDLELEDYNYLANRSPLYIMAIFAIELFKNKFQLRSLRPTLLLLLLFIYVLYGVISHGAPLTEYILHFFVSFLAPLYCCFNLFSWNQPDWEKLDRVIIFIFNTELILFFVQYFLGAFTLEFGEDSVLFSNASGTLSRGNTFASFLLLFLCYIVIRKDNMEIRVKWVYLLLGFLAILFSGVRTYMVCFVMFVPLSFFFKETRVVKPIYGIIVCLTFLFLFFTMSSINERGYATKEADNPIERQLYGLSNFTRGESVDEQSTMFLSLVVFTEYFVNNPLFGNWMLYTENSYDPVSPENENVMDAGLAVYLSDIGILGMTLYILFQLYVYLMGADMLRKKQILVLASYAIVTTYTDIGIFGGMFTCCILVLSNLLKWRNGEVDNYQMVEE